MGEAKRRSVAVMQEALVEMIEEAIGVCVQMDWIQNEAATPFGQMAYFCGVS